MLTDLGQAGAISAILAAVFTGLLLIWYLMGSPTPLSPANLRKPIRFAKRKYAERQAAKARRQAGCAERALRSEQEVRLEAFEASVLRLLDMERSAKSYHRTEWRRQINTCKIDTLRVLRQKGIRMDGGSVQYGPWIRHFETCSTVVDWGPSKRNLGTVRLVVLWHPNPSLTMGEIYSADFADGAIEHVKVLSKLLTDADMEIVDWTYPEAWRTGYWPDGSEWIPVGRSAAPADW